MGWVVLAIGLVTLAAIMVRPRGLGEAWAAAAAATAMFLVGAIGPADLFAALRETWDVLAFLLGMMALTWLAEDAGVFDRLAAWVARVARGSGLALFALVFLLAATITALLSLDVTVLILTPVVYALTVRLRLDALPFMFACTFVANTGSLALPVSNLTNLLVYSQLGLGFGAFAARMWLPNMVAVLVNFAVFLWLFRDRLPARFGSLADDAPAADWWLASAAAILAATLAALVALGLLRLPLAWAALVGGALLLAAGLLGRRVRAAHAVRAISWPLLVFVVGMFLVVRGVERVWLDQIRVVLPADPRTALALAVGGNALGSNVVNNVPMTLVSLSLISHADGAAREALAYGTLVGANIGPTLTTYGSLATMLWLALIRKRGLDVSSLAYARIAVATTPAVLLAATIALWLVLR